MADNWKHLLTLLLIAGLAFTGFQCGKEEDSREPLIRIIFEAGSTLEGDTVEIGRPLYFRIAAEGPDANLTNFTIKKKFAGTVKTALDTGLNTRSFDKRFTFYQGIEEAVEWQFTVMDRNRKQAQISLAVFKDPDSQFGGIYHFNNIRLGYQNNAQFGHFFLPALNRIFFGDSAALHQESVDVLVYFNYSEDNGVLKPSPTFSSPGEDASTNGDLYNSYYPFLKQWSTRNYTKWDIRAVNGLTEQAWNQAHNDSLLIVSYDEVWGKKKYKWAGTGMFIPFQTAAGKKGIVKVISTDHADTGSIVFSMKIQM
jgi:hypothetical protein